MISIKIDFSGIGLYLKMICSAVTMVTYNVVTCIVQRTDNQDLTHHPACSQCVLGITVTISDLKLNCRLSSALDISNSY